MSQLNPIEPDDALTIDGADLLAEIRELRMVGSTDDPAHTEPTQRRWKPPVASTEDIVDTSGVDHTISQPQLIAIALACLLGLGAAIATWRGAEPPAHRPMTPPPTVATTP